MEEGAAAGLKISIPLEGWLSLPTQKAQIDKSLFYKVLPPQIWAMPRKAQKAQIWEIHRAPSCFSSLHFQRHGFRRGDHGKISVGNDRIVTQTIKGPRAFTATPSDQKILVFDELA